MTERTKANFCAFICLLTVKIGAIASFIAIGVPLIYSSVIAFKAGFIAQGVLPLVMFALVLFAHRANIRRILTGKERKLTLFATIRTSMILSPSPQPVRSRAILSTPAPRAVMSTRRTLRLQRDTNMSPL